MLALSVIDVVKLYLIAGEALLLFCLDDDGNRVAAEFRGIESLPRLVLATMLTVLLWPLAFIVGRW